MATPIGRAGRHVFTPQQQGKGGSHEELPRSTHSPTSLQVKASFSGGKLPPKPSPKPSPPPQQRPRERSNSEESIDLEKTLAQCMVLEEDRQPKPVPTRGAPTSSSARDLETPPFPLSAKMSGPLNASAYLSRGISSKMLVEETIAMSGMDGTKKVADLEKQELLAALEVLKMQNQMLSNRIEKNQNESKIQIEFERQQRLMAIHSLERENKDLAEKMLQSKLEAEKKLEEEKAAFAHALQLLEGERNNLKSRLEHIETHSAQEIEALRSERAKMEMSILKLEVDKEQMYSRVLHIEALNDSEGMQAELEALQVHLQQMELEKQNLKLQLELNDQLQSEEKRHMEERLERERAESQERLQAMEAQQQAASTRVASANLQTEAIQEQLTSLHRHGASGQQLHTIQEGEAASSQNRSSKSSSNKAEAKKKARALQERLKSRKTDRLAAGVSRMRASFEQEKLKSQQTSNNSSTNDMSSVHSTANESVKHATSVVLEAKKSLFDMFNAAGSSADFIPKVVAQGVVGRGEGDENRYDMAAQLPTNIYANISKIYEGLNSGGVDAAAYPSPTRTVLEKRPAVLAKSASEALKQKTLFDLDSDSDNDDDDDDPEGGHVSKKTKAQSAKAPAAAQVSSGSDCRPQAAPSSSGAPSGSKDTGSHQDLPEGHAAAARGDLPRLKDLVTSDPGLLDSLDVSQRPVLFYAAVHGHVNVIIYLLQLYTNNIHSVFGFDVFGDSIIHAAVCSNNPVCLELIVGKLDKVYAERSAEKKEIINHRNSYGMTAVHMASHLSCLELLYKVGADVSIVDAQSRTPLFIFCLLNNEPCVNFLINSYDSVEYLYKADYRGDTPLHAAACNGSVDCLLTLLQQGIDPRIVNAQNLRAVDLAIRNKQVKCREILAEYLLHYCTSSDFDSVLFLAALEGHRFIAQNVHKIPAPQHGQVDPSGAAALPKMLNNQHIYPSLFTLRDAKAMRLQRFGQWIAYHDPYTHQVFWYSHERGSGQWEVPEEVAQYQQRPTGTDEDDEHLSKVLQSKLSMRMRREGDWIEYSTQGSPPIYYNEKDGSFTWEDPNDPSSLEANRNIDYEEYAIAHDGLNGRYQNLAIEDGAFTFDPAVSCDYDPTAEGIGGSWQPYCDDSTGSIYWYNAETAESQWENPYGAENDDRVLRVAIANSGGRPCSYDEDHHDATPINNLSDLGF